MEGGGTIADFPKFVVENGTLRFTQRPRIAGDDRPLG